MKLKPFLLAATASVFATAAHAEFTGGVIKIGVLNDQSGVYADLSGQGSVWAAKKAVEDYCKENKCAAKVEVIFADHQNKPILAPISLASGTTSREWTSLWTCLHPLSRSR